MGGGVDGFHRFSGLLCALRYAKYSSVVSNPRREMRDLRPD